MNKNKMNELIDIHKEMVHNLNIYKDYIFKILQKHKTLMKTNNHSFYNFNFSLDLLYFNKQILEKEFNYFLYLISFFINKLYQDLFEHLKQLLKSLHCFYDDIDKKTFFPNYIHNVSSFFLLYYFQPQDYQYVHNDILH